MSIQRAFAAGNETPLMSIEISHSGLTQTFRFCEGYSDLDLTLEDSSVVTFTGLGLGISRPSRNSEGSQDINFSLDNTNLVASDQIRNVILQSRLSKESATLTFRSYLPSDLVNIAEGPYVFVIKGSQRNRNRVDITASFFKAGSLSFPFYTYNVNDFPGVKYV